MVDTVSDLTPIILTIWKPHASDLIGERLWTSKSSNIRVASRLDQHKLHACISLVTLGHLCRPYHQRKSQECCWQAQRVFSRLSRAWRSPLGKTSILEATVPWDGSHPCQRKPQKQASNATFMRLKPKGVISPTYETTTQIDVRTCKGKRGKTLIHTDYTALFTRRW
jgi:hypothetical protein